MRTEHEQPRVFILENTLFAGALLSSIVQEAGCEVVRGSGADPCAALAEVEARVDLALIPLQLETAPTLDAIRRLRARGGWRASIPILAVGPLDSCDIRIVELQELGILGVIDRRALPEHVRFRVCQVVFRGAEGRRFERAPCCLPVEVEVNGDVHTEYAVSLSIAGMGIMSSRRIERNTPVAVRFALDGSGGERVEAEGRIVHVREVEREGTVYEMGLFFYPLPVTAQAAISEEVERLLAAWRAIEGLDLESKDDPPVVSGTFRPR